MVWSLLRILADFGAAAAADVHLFVCNETEEIYLEVSDTVMFCSENSCSKVHQIVGVEWVCCRVRAV
jgi:hypothetical protein